MFAFARLSMIPTRKCNCNVKSWLQTKFAGARAATCMVLRSRGWKVSFWLSITLYARYVGTVQSSCISFPRFWIVCCFSKEECKISHTNWTHIWSIRKWSYVFVGVYWSDLYQCKSTYLDTDVKDKGWSSQICLSTIENKRLFLSSNAQSLWLKTLCLLHFFLHKFFSTDCQSVPCLIDCHYERLRFIPTKTVVNKKSISRSVSSICRYVVWNRRSVLHQCTSASVRL